MENENKFCTSRLIRIFFSPDQNKAVLFYRKKYVWQNKKHNTHYFSVLWNLQSSEQSDDDTFLHGQWMTDKKKGRMDFKLCKWNEDNTHFTIATKRGNCGRDFWTVIPPNFSAIQYSRREKPHCTFGTSDKVDWDIGQLPSALHHDIEKDLEENELEPYITTDKYGRKIETKNGQLFINEKLRLDVSTRCFENQEPIKNVT